MRIYFVGSHATGKTTMTRWVSKRYGLPMITEVARGVLAEMETDFNTLRTDVDLVGEYQRRVFERQMSTEYLTAKGDPSAGFVSDRAFDNLAYAADHALVLTQLTKASDFDDYLKWLRAGIVFFLRPHPELCKADLVRQDAQWENVVRIDGMVKFMLELFDIPHLSISSLSMQERVRAVEYVIGHRGH